MDALAGIDLRLPVKRQVIGLLGDQHLGDQGFGGYAAFNNMSRRRGQDDRSRARAAAVTSPAGDQDTQRGRHDIKPLCDIRRSHTARTAGRLTFGDLLVGYERLQVLDALHGEGHDAVFVCQAVDPDQAVFGIRAER